jgi:hypothetical protein
METFAARYGGSCDKRRCQRIMECLTLSLLMSYIYGAPSKARILTSYVYGRDFYWGFCFLNRAFR